MARRLAAVAFAVIVGSVGFVGELRAVTPQQATRIQDELRFRRDFGLGTDLATIQQLMHDPAAYQSQYPLALTSAEMAEMDRRIAMESQMIPLEEYSEKQPSFAGHWIDQPNGGRIKVAFAGDADQHRPAIAALAPPGSKVDVFDVKYTLAELDISLEQVEQARIGLKSEGVWIRTLGINPTTNRVEIGVADSTDAAVSELRSRFGDAIIVEQSGNPIPSGCTDRLHCAGPPIRAGIGAPTNAAVPCSIAFLVRKSGAVGWLTAGHCAKTVGAVWQHNGISIGTIRATCWPGCLYSDAARAGELNATYSSYHVWRSYAIMNPVGSAQGFNADDIGDYTCLNARQSLGWRCGYIEEIKRVDYPGGVYFLEQRYASYQGLDGDSGGAVHSYVVQSGNYVIAYGVQSGCEDTTGDHKCTTADTGRGIYSHIFRVTQELGVTVCKTSAPCP